MKYGDRREWTLNGLLSGTHRGTQTIVRNNGSCKLVRLNTGDGTLGAALGAPPDAEGDDDRKRQRKPGDGVLQVIVLETHGERAGFSNAALVRWRCPIDIERRHGLAALAPAQRARHR